MNSNSKECLDVLTFGKCTKGEDCDVCHCNKKLIVKEISHAATTCYLPKSKRLPNFDYKNLAITATSSLNYSPQKSNEDDDSECKED